MPRTAEYNCHSSGDSRPSKQCQLMIESHPALDIRPLRSLNPCRNSLIGWYIAYIISLIGQGYRRRYHLC